MDALKGDFHVIGVMRDVNGRGESFLNKREKLTKSNIKREKAHLVAVQRELA